jgi:hypothetical protein
MKGFQFKIPDTPTAWARVAREGEVELSPEDRAIWMEVEVCQQMIDLMLEVVCEGLKGSDTKSAKKWVKCVLFTIAKLVNDSADESSREEVIGKILEKWTDRMRAYERVAAKKERIFRLETELATHLHANGWEEEAVKYDKSAQDLLKEGEIATSYLALWQKLIEQTRAKS